MSLNLPWLWEQEAFFAVWTFGCSCAGLVINLVSLQGRDKGHWRPRFLRQLNGWGESPPPPPLQVLLTPLAALPWIGIQLNTVELHMNCCR